MTATAMPGEQGSGIRELRLAVVCYGGVSLAIYMHGITKELHKLVVASEAYERDPGRNPFAAHDTERVYWDLLHRLACGEAGAGVPVRLRVVVDIIAGTSAGGINGICLAKGLACNRSQDELTELWLDKGDIAKLLRGWRPLPALLKVGWIALSAASRPHAVAPPLRGDDMCRWLHQAMQDMSAGRPALEGAGTLVPAGHRLQLFVPVTDFTGYDRDIPLYDPRFVLDRTHRHVMSFVHGASGGSDFDGAHDHMLAFAARATSSFPGAFPPVSFAEYERCFDGDADLAAEAPRFFPLHATAGVEPARTYFVDGGVLDNFPFRAAIEAIAQLPAASEVDRRLVYIEPDPGGDDGATATGDGRLPPPPGLYRTVFGGYAGIPRKEPILDDLLQLAGRNEAVLRVRDVIEAGFGTVSAHVAEVLADELPHVAPGAVPGADQLAAFRRRVEDRARRAAGFNAHTYARLRVRSVVDGYADLVSSVLAFPEGSSQRWFVGAVLRQWALDEGLLAQAPDEAGQQRQQDLLERLDLQYHQRRVRFLVAALNWLYRDVDRPGYPSRAELDAAKARLYGHLGEVEAVAAGLAQDPDVATDLGRLFTVERMTKARGQDELLAAAFVDEHRAALAALRERAETRVAAALPGLEAAFHEDVVAFATRYHEFLAGALLTRYVGFPFWDMLVYPLQAVSGVGERDHVEVYRFSPRDARLLPGERLAGMTVFHFGAFFKREYREHDYLWGRLHGAERLIKLLLDVRREPATAATATDRTQQPVVADDVLAAEAAPAFEAVLADERRKLDAGAKGALVSSQELLDRLEGHTRRLRRRRATDPSDA